MEERRRPPSGLGDLYPGDDLGGIGSRGSMFVIAPA
jgi:hypothetical protein